MLRFWKHGKQEPREPRKTPLLALGDALKAKGFHTDSYSRFSGLHDTILVWKDVPGRGEVAFGYIVLEKNPTFCFEIDKRDDPHVVEICNIIRTLQGEGFAITISPMAYIILPPVRSVHKEETTAG